MNSFVGLLYITSHGKTEWIIELLRRPISTSQHLSLDIGLGGLLGLMFSDRVTSIYSQPVPTCLSVA